MERESRTDAPTWAERLARAVRVWKFYDQLPDDARMDRVFKESGVRDVIVENAQLRERLTEAQRGWSAAEWTIRQMRERPDLDSMRQLAADHVSAMAKP